MYKVTIKRNDHTYNYTCEDCGWRDATTFSMTFSKKEDHTMRVSLYRNDSIEVKDIDEKSKVVK